MGERGEKMEVAWKKVKRRRETERREGDDNDEYREKEGRKYFSPFTCA